jgi:exonuclease III
LDIERNRVPDKKKKERFFARNQFAQISDVWTDAWRVHHPDSAEYSWYSHRGNGWRIDHAFVSPALRPAVIAADYLHEPRTEGLTDHAAPFVTLDLTRLAGAAGYEEVRG